MGNLVVDAFSLGLNSLCVGCVTCYVEKKILCFRLHASLFHVGVCSVRFQSVFMGMANRNQIFRFVKFSTEIDRNGWKSIDFGIFRF